MRDKILRQHAREPDHVVDVLLRIDRGQRAAWFFQRVDHLGTRPAQTGIECGKLPGWTGAYDRDVEDVVARNRARRIEDRPGCLRHGLRLLARGCRRSAPRFDAASDSSIAPVFGSCNPPVPSAQFRDDSRLSVRKRPVDPKMRENAQKRSGEDGDGMTAANPGSAPR